MDTSTEICQGGGVRGFVNYHSCKNVNSLTLRIIVLPFSSIREDHTVHQLYPAVYNTGMGGWSVDVWSGVGWGVGVREGVGGMRCRSEGGVGWGEV